MSIRDELLRAGVPEHVDDAAALDVERVERNITMAHPTRIRVRAERETVVFESVGGRPRRVEIPAARLWDPSRAAPMTSGELRKALAPLRRPSEQEVSAADVEHAQELGTRTGVDLATLATLILKSLSWGPLHGYGIARWIEQVTEDELLVEEGSLYPALHRLQARDLVSSQWTISDTNRRVRLYTLTEQGRQQLRAELSRWERFSVAVTRALQARRPSKVV